MIDRRTESVRGRAAGNRDPHALGVALTHRTTTQIDPSQPFQVEFKVVNTGKAPPAVPVSPNLSDLQFVDDSVLCPEIDDKEMTAGWVQRLRDVALQTQRSLDISGLLDSISFAAILHN